jgi:hypothetical protein
MIAFIDDHRDVYGVEPICKVLPIAPSTYHAHVGRRSLRDPLAGAAGELLPHVLQHLPVARHHLEGLGDVLAELG